jgi:tripeptide aminopeptidase
MEALLERFLRYVRFDTQSDPASLSFPSTPNQLKLGALLADELKAMGINDVNHDRYGYVTAVIPSNVAKKVPTLLFCSHLDTSPDCEASDIKPIVHKNYRGTDLLLPCNPPIIISPKDFPELLDKGGMDIITSDGTTLLSADNKAGLAELMEVANQLMNRQELKHGKIILLFVPDEEIGKDVMHLDVKKLEANYAYTIDGHDRGSINDTTFSIANVKLEIQGSPMHTGAGHHLMENSIRIASEIVNTLPPSIWPEVSGERKGFIHASHIEGKMKSSELTFQLRAFNDEELHTLSEIIRETATTTLKRFPRSSFTFSFKITDKNIYGVLKDHPAITENAAEAMRRAGLKPKIEPLRGATTGTGLSAMGLPTANLFTGQHANHSKMEWICAQDMEKAVEAILHLCEVWQERS